MASNISSLYNMDDLLGIMYVAGYKANQELGGGGDQGS